MPYILDILVFTCIYTILAASFDLLAGHTGILSIAHAAFYGLGAYSSAIITVSMGGTFLEGVFVGMLVATAISFIVSLPSLRLRDDYFVIATFGFQVILFSLFNNWMSLTNGPLGIVAIPQPSILSWTIKSRWQFLILAGLFAAVAYLVVGLVATSPFGRVLRAIREDEVFASSQGKNPLRFKVLAFAISAALAGAAGSLYAHYISYIDPTSFTVTESILIISMVIIGGAGSTWGPFVGAMMLVIIPELLRFIGMPNSVAANLRQIFYGGLLVIVVMFRPRGLMGRYGFGR